MKNNLSDRARRCNPSATLKISEMADELEKKGKDVISLGVGEPDFDTPEPIKKRCKEAIDNGFVHYTDSQGITELREKISQKLKKENKIDVNKDEILTTPGAKYAIYLTLQGLVDPGDEVILFDPAWVTYPESIKLAGGKTKWCPTKKDHTPSIKDFKELIDEEVSLVIVNSPCNPTGKVYSKDKLKSIAEIAEEKDCFVLSDEIYEKIIYEKNHYSLASDYQNIITVNGFSKTYSMTGWRLGYLAASNELIEELTNIQQHSVSCPTSFVQKGAISAFEEETKSFVDEMIKKFKKRRDILMDELDKIQEIECNEPEGTFYAFPEIGIDSLKFSKRALKIANVAITPGSAFGKKGKGHFRISFANSENRIKEAIKRIQNNLDEIIGSDS